MLAGRWGRWNETVLGQMDIRKRHKPVSVEKTLRYHFLGHLLTCWKRNCLIICATDTQSVRLCPSILAQINFSRCLQWDRFICDWQLPDEESLGREKQYKKMDAFTYCQLEWYKYFFFLNVTFLFSRFFMKKKKDYIEYQYILNVPWWICAKHLFPTPGSSMFWNEHNSLVTWWNRWRSECALIGLVCMPQTCRHHTNGDINIMVLNDKLKVLKEISLP